MEWIELYADMMSKTAQNSQRRGFITFYCNADHPEIMDFLDIGTERIPKDKQRFLTTVTTAVVLPKGFRQALKAGDKEKRKIFTKILNTRKEAGFPYILDVENSNKGICQAYINKGLEIRNANICAEAIEYADYEKTFACCLSSIVAYYWDEIKEDPNFLFDMNIMLDCVIEEYIEKGRKIPGIHSAIKFAEEHRAIGLGISAFHSYLQKNMIEFGSLESFGINGDIFSTMRKEGDRASRWMAEHFGEPKMLEGYGERNTSRMAQAPKKSSSFIDGGITMAFSEGIEPHKINYGEKMVAKIQVEWKNRELEKLLKEKGKDTEKVWNSILAYGGSVQHLDFLSDHEKAVFKVFHEISQVDVVNLAAQRQEHIDMGQSINLAIHPSSPPRDVIKLHLDAFDKGIKSLYYQYNLNAAQQFSQELLTCSACEG
jgi:ribonucleoside-diphosphate reductase alpha chain